MTENIKCPTCGSENIEQVDKEDGKLCSGCICLWDESKRQPVNAWIACGERLPEDNKICLVIHRDKDEITYYDLASFDSSEDGWWSIEPWPIEVDYWLPLPAEPVAGKD